MIKKTRKLIIYAFAFIASTLSTACHDTKSYAELLTDENQATNSFLVNQRVLTTIPSDTVFETGINAPYYQLDEEGNVFMQVLDSGTKGDKAEYDQLIYFRFTRFSLYDYSYKKGDINQAGYFGSFSTDGEGNDSDVTAGSTSFRFNNFKATTSSEWGMGIQMPLIYLPVDCRVNLIVKSPYGRSNEIGYVIPYFYRNIRYFKSQI